MCDRGQPSESTYRDNAGNRDGRGTALPSLQALRNPRDDCVRRERSRWQHLTGFSTCLRIPGHLSLSAAQMLPLSLSPSWTRSVLSQSFVGGVIAWRRYRLSGLHNGNCARRNRR